MAATITVILESKDEREYARVILSDVGPNFLELTEQDYPLLSQVDDCSLTVFASNDMPELETELAKFRESVKDEKAQRQIAEVIDLSRRCRLADLVLVFTAFGDLR